MHILLIEDSRRLRESLTTGLTRCGYAVDVAGDGEAGLRFARHNSYDVILLDLMLPRVDGLEVLKQLRQSGDDTHVLILTARGTIDERVAGLREGADDYVPKPFALDELLARVDALVRRKYRTKQPIVTAGALSIDTAARRVSRAGREIHLSRREYALLEYLAFRKGHVVARRQIEDHLYAEHNFPSSNAVDRVICTLRRKIDAPGTAPVISTRRGLGYILDEPAT
jgi:DNA-binding response OmpR family regulator